MRIILSIFVIILISSCQKSELIDSKILIENQLILIHSEHPFYLSKFEVDQALFEKVMGYNPTRFKNPVSPVGFLTPREIIRFLNSLSKLEGLEPYYQIDEQSGTAKPTKNATGYRLPSLTEWDAAFTLGDTNNLHSKDLQDYAWFSDNTNFRAMPCGQKLPNSLGIHDMLGNVWEYCFDENTAAISFPIKGGGYPNSRQEIDGKITTYMPINGFHSMIGFRLARN